jgi:hypothetical protein
MNQAHASVLTACGYSITERELVDRFCGMSDPEMLAVIERNWGRRLPASYGACRSADRKRVSPISESD